MARARRGGGVLGDALGRPALSRSAALLGPATGWLIGCPRWGSLCGRSVAQSRPRQSGGGRRFAGAGRARSVDVGLGRASDWLGRLQRLLADPQGCQLRPRSAGEGSCRPLKHRGHRPLCSALASRSFASRSAATRSAPQRSRASEIARRSRVLDWRSVWAEGHERLTARTSGTSKAINRRIPGAR